MKRIATQVLAIALAILLLFTLAPVMAFAAGEADTEVIETVWNGGSMSIDVAAGSNGYTHLSVYASPYHAYEMSNHMVTAGETNSIPQTLVMVDATEDYTWTPNGPYSFADSNYEVLYCCDAYTGYNNGIYYKRMNLEDAGYCIVEEDMVLEDGKYYPVMKAKLGNMHYDREIEYLYGKILLDKKHPVLKDFLERKMDNSSKIMQKLKQDGKQEERMLKRMQELQDEMLLMQEALKRFEA